ncbi:MAG: 1-deoxy-D-xylulose-5-phosphate synthase [Nitrospinaceae bacterium]|nr:1-deoxy-D-xylulose-5-phosphate synthase [Nitrospinaceae bacterium]
MSKFFDDINSPADLKRLKREDLPKVAEEIRELLLQSISKTGGHLGSNLGVVELTMALHYVFDSPVDKFVWDVGHQSYVHKLLTGRKGQFDKLRQYDGLCGFSKREESEHDHWNVGHGGTSVAAALAFAKARDLKNKKNKVVAIIGDGSLTAGMAFEGLNHAGHLKSDVIVVLNDNKMSISTPVGGMSAHLSQILTGQVMTKFKQEVDKMLLAIPGVGKDVSQYAHRLDEAVKGMFIPGRLFEDLGFRYIGPVDGHDTDLMIDTLDTVSGLKGPTLIHVVTRKGKGYEIAEEKADVWHGAKPFVIATGEFLSGRKSHPAYTNVFAESLIELAKEDEKIIGITAAMPDGTGISKFGKVFPERTFDVAMAEQHGVGFAGALSIEGFKPVVAIYSTFMQRAYDQVVHDICLMNLPVTFAMDRAGIVGEDGATHQGLFDISFMRALPNMVVMAPKDENELRHMLKTSINHPGPSSLRYPRGAGLGVEQDAEIKELEIGKGEVIKDGTDLAIFAFGAMVDPSMKTAAMLEEKGLRVAVINARFAKPIDKDLILEYAEKTGCIVTTEEHAVQGGFGSAVLEALQDMDENVPLKTKCIGVPDIVVEHGAVGLIKRDLKLDPEGMFETILSFMSSTSNSTTQGNGDKASSGNGKKELKSGIKKPITVKQPING